MTKHQYRAFAEYNKRMNRKLYGATAKLSPADRTADKGAFFKSAQHTLQHIMVADIIWLKRFGQLKGCEWLAQEMEKFPTINSLDQEIHPDFNELTKKREALDAVIAKFIENLTDETMIRPFQYTNMKGKQFEGELWTFISHLFNHQTHHRGQTTTLLTQMGQDVGVTDFPFVLKEME